jgi:hypothetical protein
VWSPVVSVVVFDGLCGRFGLENMGGDFFSAISWLAPTL